MKYPVLCLPFLSVGTAFSPSSFIASPTTNFARNVRTRDLQPSPLSLFKTKEEQKVAEVTTTNGAKGPLSLFKTKDEPKVAAKITTNGAPASTEGEWIDESKKVELIALSIWMISICGFILINNFTGPWPAVMKTVPERVYFLSHMIGGMLFGGGIILTTCIERLVSKSNNAPVLQFWFDKVPLLDGLIVVPALTVSMISGTGLSIVRYGGLNIAPPHVGAIFWTLIAFLTWWAVTDLTTQGTALAAANEMYSQYEDGDENVETPKVIADRHVSNVVSCFFVVTLYSFMVLKPGDRKSVV